MSAPLHPDAGDAAESDPDEPPAPRIPGPLLLLAIALFVAGLGYVIYVYVKRR